MRAIIMAIVLMALIACNPLSQRIPAADDVEGLKRVAASLSPWEDDSPDRSHDKRTIGERDSDRQLFARWFVRYASHEAYAQHDRDYEPFPVPSSVRAAILEQANFESEERIEAELAQEEQQQQDARADAARKAESQKAEQQRQVEAYARRVQQNAENARQEMQLQCEEKRRKAGEAAMDAPGSRGGISYQEAAAAVDC